MKDMHDELEGYCRMLGHRLPFRYCREVNEGLPCRKIMDCWYDVFPVLEFLARNYSEEELKIAFGTPKKTRIESIIEIVHKARSDAEGSGGE